MTEAKTKVKKITQKVYCRTCHNPTTHKVLKEVKIGDFDDDSGIGIWYTYYMLQCMGCETVCLLEKYECSEDLDYNINAIVPRYSIYPNPYINREAVRETYYLPRNITNIYKESINAFNASLPILTSIGLRAIIEGVCINNNITTGGLESKIDILVTKNLITKKEGELLHMNRYMGNASAHELVEPTIDELETGIDIIEALLRNAYILPIKAEKIKTGIPKK